MATNMTQSIRGKRILFAMCSMELGGAERQGLHLARHLKGLGCDVRIWSTHTGVGLLAEECEAEGIPWSVHRFIWPCRKSSLVRDAWKMTHALRRERPDVILSYTTWPNVGCGLTWRLSPAQACIWGQRCVHDLRGDIVERLAYRQASAVICNAQHEVDYLRRTLGETPAPTHVIYNGVDMKPAQKSRAEWRAEFGIASQTPVATMVANFRAEKDHRTLLEAWEQMLASMPERCAPPRLLLAGAPQYAYADIRSFADNLALNGTVVFPGQVKDISGLLAASDLGVLASKHEGLPNAVIEYMTSGLPVVATDLPGNREALGPYPESLLCPVGDVASLARALRSLIASPALRQELGSANRERATAEFSIRRMCQKTTDLICDMLKAE